MPNVELKDYIQALTAFTPDDDDSIPVYDTSTDTLKRVEVSALVPRGDYALNFDELYHQHVNFGRYWDADHPHSIFFYEAWVSPKEGAEYVISDGYGGDHNLLWGFNGFPSGYGTMSGNIKLNGATFSFVSQDGIYEGDWHHIAVGWDGETLRTYVDGVLSRVYSAIGTRQTGGNVSEGVMFVGGSDHSNYHGYIRNIRGFEGWCPVVDNNSSFRPERDFRSYVYGPTGPGSASFLIDLSLPQNTINDLSDGYSNGIRQTITNTVVGPAGITTNGDARAVVTAAGMSNSPKTVTVPVTTASHTTADLIAAAFRTALLNDADVTSFFTVAGTGADVKLIAINPDDNDGTMNVTIEDVTSDGITDDVTAVQTYAGVKGERIRHTGYRSAESDAGMIGGFGGGLVNALGPMPQFEAVTFIQPTAFRGTPLAIPSGAIVYDDFSRANVTQAWTTISGVTLGASRTGQVWTGSGMGIIDGCAYSHALLGATSYIEKGVTDQDVRITRKNDIIFDNYSITLRYTDANNKIYMYLHTGIYFDIRQTVAGVDTSIGNGDISASWSVLRFAVSGTAVDVYVDGGASEGSGTTTLATGTKVGMTIPGLGRITAFEAR